MQQTRSAISNHIINGMLAVMIAGIIAAVVSPSEPDAWATIDDKDLHAAWAPQSGTVELSALVTKYHDCDRVIVASLLRPIEENAIEVGAIELKLSGRFQDDLKTMATGVVKSVFDEGVPARSIAPGHYLLSLQAFCELQQTTDVAAKDSPVPVTPTTLSTQPSQVVVVVDPPGKRGDLRTRARMGMAAGGTPW